MDTNSIIKATGQVSISLRDSAGNIKEQRTIKNLVVATGKEYIASRMIGTSSPVMSHMAVGSNSVSALDSNSTLGQEIDRTDNAFSAVANNNTVSYSATFLPGVGTGPITEVGIFNSAITGTMLARTTFAVVNKAEVDTLTINWNITIN